MSRTLSPVEFELPNVGRKPVSGNQVLHEFGFNPNLCQIKVDAKGWLHINQTGVVTFDAAPGYWKEVKK